MSVKVAQQSIFLDPAPSLASTATVAGPMEGAGPLGSDFDFLYKDQRAGEKSFEAAERKMLLEACSRALEKGSFELDTIEYFLSGDLLNQITVSGYSAAVLGRPFFGLYGACSTWPSAFVEHAGGRRFAANVLAAASEPSQQRRTPVPYPTEYGFQRPPQYNGP